jgi:hypothetical protein
VHKNLETETKSYNLYLSVHSSHKDGYGFNIWGFHSGDYEECRLLGYKNPVCTSQETHYVCATELSQLMLCKIWGVHSSDYEECHLLGYKNPVRTSQETHYISATEPSQLMLCKICGFHSSDYEECRLLGCYAVWLLYWTLILIAWGLILSEVHCSKAASLMFYDSISLKRQRKCTSLRQVSQSPTQICSEHFLNSNLEHYQQTGPLGDLKLNGQFIC